MRELLVPSGAGIKGVHVYIEMRTEKSVREAGKAFEVAAGKRKIGVLHVIDLLQTLVEGGMIFDKELLIYEVCHPYTAKVALDTNVRLSNSFPCRISIFRESDRTVISAIKPTFFLTLFKEPTLVNLYKEFEEVLEEVIQEAA